MQLWGSFGEALPAHVIKSLIRRFQVSLAIRKSAVRHFLLASFVLLCSLAANAQQLYQVTTPQGDVLIGKHVQNSNSFGLFDLYDPKTGICVVTNDASYVDPNTHLPGKLSSPNMDYIEEIGRIKAGFGKNVVAMYTGSAPKLGAPCSGGTSAATTPGAGAAGELPHARRDRWRIIGMAQHGPLCEPRRC